LSLQFQCITCGAAFDDRRVGLFACNTCGEKYEIAEGYLKTQFDKKLFNSFRKDYLLNKVLNNNGYISYQQLQEGSISLPEREDVIRFRNFLRNNLYGRRILDMGCGVMETPGYLMLNYSDQYELIGLDPIDDNNFSGFRIVGCSEFVPLPDECIDTVIFATSMDHVCNLKKTINETQRLLCYDGKVIVWMSDRSAHTFDRLKNWLRRRRDSWRLGYSVDKYYVYPNWTVLGVPLGGVDPFHSYLETPRKIIRLFSNAGMKLTAQERHSNVEVFLSFEKTAT